MEEGDTEIEINFKVNEIMGERFYCRMIVKPLKLGWKIEPDDLHGTKKEEFNGFSPEMEEKIKKTLQSIIERIKKDERPDIHNIQLQ